ncbi:MAG TPA: folylpolyglutamate synthase/dihydrofolate synthase family protein [Egibacteraceae bacterium]|nr:folylpolyglutamate synthase/dihydrofolate synthase family protein [Egibacteraceae bacterium]
MTSQPDYDATIARLFDRQPNRMVPDLERIRALCDLLGHPQQAYPGIHITGTNGKTTTAAMITALLGALGLNTGTYTSPHLQDVRERVRVAGRPAERIDVAAGLAYLDPFIDRVDADHPDPVTFFEVLTALAFVHFADAPVDVGVFEVGMGGRWDATNVVDAQVAVLTDISLDHPELGAHVRSVAEEKSGIIKPGAVVVSAAQPDEAMEVVARQAADCASRLVVAGKDFGLIDRRTAVGGQQLHLRGVTGDVADVYLPLHGLHQAANAAYALVAVEAFLGFAGGIDPDVIREGFAAVTSPGRLEVVRDDGAAPVILDGAHNPAGMRSLAVALANEFAFRNRVVVLGVLDDKDVEAMVAELKPVADHVVVTRPQSERAASTDTLLKAVQAAGLSAEAHDPVDDALEAARGLAADNDAVVVTGSLYTVGAARDALGLPPG